MSEAQTIDELASKLLESLNITRVSPPLGRDVPFIGLEQERVRLDLGYNQFHRTGYVRVGDLIFLDYSFKDKINPEILREMQHNIIYIFDFETSSLAATSLTRYSALTIHASSCVEVQGKAVLDLGSADGVLSLVAKRKGARKIIAVDNNLDMANKLSRHITANNMRQSAFGFLPGDVRSPNLLMRIPLEEINVIVANLGPEYGSSHLYAIEMLDHMPNVQTFIAGGYNNNEDDSYSPREAIKLLEQKGFRIFGKIVEDDEIPRLAFIAERHYQ